MGALKKFARRVYPFPPRSLPSPPLIILPLFLTLSPSDSLPHLSFLFSVSLSLIFPLLCLSLMSFSIMPNHHFSCFVFLLHIPIILSLSSSVSFKSEQEETLPGCLLSCPQLASAGSAPCICLLTISPVLLHWPRS